MARHDRCSICDYSEVNGSAIGGTNPGDNGRVRIHTHRSESVMLCDSCATTIHQTILTQAPVAEVSDGEVELLED